MPKVIKQKTYTDYKTAKAKDKPYKIFDGGGLALCVRPSGQKTWQFDYARRNFSYTDNPTRDNASNLILRKSHDRRTKEKAGSTAMEHCQRIAW